MSTTDESILRDVSAIPRNCREWCGPRERLVDLARRGLIRWCVGDDTRLAGPDPNRHFDYPQLTALGASLIGVPAPIEVVGIEPDDEDGTEHAGVYYHEHMAEIQRSEQ